MARVVTWARSLPQPTMKPGDVILADRLKPDEYWTEDGDRRKSLAVTSDTRIEHIDHGEAIDRAAHQHKKRETRKEDDDQSSTQPKFGWIDRPFMGTHDPTTL